MEASTIISLSKEIKSRNFWDKQHWSKRSRESKDWEKQIWAALNGAVKKHRAKGRTHIKITSLRKRLLDHANLSGGFKGGMDALKRLGLIVDDSPKWIDEIYEQKVQASGTGTIIEIEEEV